MAGRIKGITIEIGGDVSPLNKALEGVNKTSRNLQQELRQVDRLLKLDPKNTELVAQKQKLLADAITNTKEKLTTLKEAQRQVEEQFKRGEIGEEQYRALQREVIKTEQDLKKLETQLRSVNSTAEALGQKLQTAGASLKKSGEEMKKFGDGLVDVGKTMTAAITAPVVGLLTGLVKTGIEFKAFKQEAKQAFSVLLGSAEAAQKHMDNIMAFAKTTPFAFPDLVDANRTLVSFGMAADRTMPVMEAIANAVAAMGGGAQEIGELSDVFARIESQGKITGQELNRLGAKGINAVAIMANQAGLSMDDMRKKISSGAIDSKTAIDWLVGGIMKGTKGIAGETVALGGSLSALKQTWGGAMDSLKGAWRNAADEIVSDEMFEKVIEGIHRLTAFVKELPKILGPVAETLGDIFLKIIDKLVALTDWFSNLSPEMQQFYVKLGAIVVAAGPALIVIGKLAGAIGSIKVVTGSVVGSVGKLISWLGTLGGAAGVASAGLAGTGAAAGAAATGVTGAGVAAGGAAAGFGALLGPILLVVAAVAAVIAGTVLLVKHLRKEVVPEVDLFADHVSASVNEVTGAMDVMEVKISDTTKEAVGAYMELDDSAQRSLMNLHLKSTKITGKIKDDMVGQYKEMNDQLVTGMKQRKDDELDLLQKTFAESSVLTEGEEAKALIAAEKHWDEKIGRTEGYQNKINEIFERAAEERRSITEAEYNEILRMQNELKEESVRILSENEIEAQIILERMKDYDGRITAETMAEHIKEVNRGRDEAVAAAEEEYDKRLAAIIRLRDETGSISAAQADKLIEEAKRTRDEAIGKADDLRLGVLDKMRGMNSDLDNQVNTVTGTILTNWEKLKRWWSGWQPETKVVSVVEQRSGSFGGHTPQYATGTSWHPGGLAIVGERGPELVSLPRGTKVYPSAAGLGAQEVKHSGTITVRGVNDQNQLTGVVDIILEKLLQEVRA